MKNGLDLYNSGYSLEEIGVNLFDDTVSSSPGAVAKAVGDFTSALAKPFLDAKRIDALETTLIIVSRRKMEVRKAAIKALEDVLMNQRLCPEAQERAIDALLKLGNGEG